MRNRVITLTVGRSSEFDRTPVRASWLNYSSSGQRDAREFMSIEAAKNYCLQRFGACRFIDLTSA